MILLPWLVLVVAGFGLALPEYSQWRYPVALLGASGIDHARAFGLLGFVVPGVLAAFAALAVFADDRQSWIARVGVQLLFLSGLAFAGLGLFPLDPMDLEGPATQHHSTAWLLWEVAFIPAMLALGMAVASRDRDRGLAWLCWGAGAVVLVTGFVPLLPAPLAQRLGFAAWAAWFGLAAARWPQRA
ncbi:MAG TPA: DUF998 domain-containing protein [Stenotrophomonas sp.]|nr:DUF998 domain-containing protein [Stenotrophomonas sp.]